MWWKKNVYQYRKAPVVGYVIEGVGLALTDREGHEVNA